MYRAHFEARIRLGRNADPKHGRRPVGKLELVHIDREFAGAYPARCRNRSLSADHAMICSASDSAMSEPPRSQISPRGVNYPALCAAAAARALPASFLSRARTRAVFPCMRVTFGRLIARFFFLFRTRVFLIDRWDMHTPPQPV